MEPAGSQGVWSLDDYQFVSFIWGAGQMVDHPRVKPKTIGDYDMAEMLAPDYHFFGCIKYIGSVKTGPFSEHSNQLWNVSGVPLWSKVYTGLVKMYRAEVLSKFPVIQHTYFGSVFTLDPCQQKCPRIQSLEVSSTKPAINPGSRVPHGAMPPMGAMPSMHRGTMPPMGAMPPTRGAIPPMGAMPPRDILPPMGAMPTRGTMPPMGVMPARNLPSSTGLMMSPGTASIQKSENSNLGSSKPKNIELS